MCSFQIRVYKDISEEHADVQGSCFLSFSSPFDTDANGGHFLPRMHSPAEVFAHHSSIKVYYFTIYAIPCQCQECPDNLEFSQAKGGYYISPSLLDPGSLSL